MKALDQKLFRDLLNWRGQMIAIMLIVICGIASFVTMTSTYESLKLSQDAYYYQYRFAQAFGQLKRAPDSLVPKIAAIPGVAQVQTRVVRDVTIDVPGRKEPAIGRLVSIPEKRTRMLNELFIRQGRYIQANQRNEVLVSEAFAQANHLQLGDSLGAVINGRWQPLRIVGIALSPEYVYEIRGTGEPLPDNERFGVIWMGRDTLGTAFNMDGAFNDVALSLTPGAIEADVIFHVDRLLEPYGGFGAYERKDQVSNRFLSDEIDQLKATATLVPALFLGIAGFLLHILLSRLVSTQRDQIAVLKAFGYDHLAIGLHYLKFVLVIIFPGTVGGTLLGLRLGSLFTEYYTQFFRFPLLRYEASIGLLTIALAISILSAVFGAFSAVRWAVSLPPAEAMRPEPPVSFRPTFIEQIGLQRLLTPVGRMILRSIERRPIRAVLSTLGIALAVSTLVAGGFLNDAIDRILTVQFYNVQRQDMTIIFNEARPARTRYEVAHLPGVLTFEPFRSVPVRLRFEHRFRRVGIMGLEPDGQLRRLVDQNLNTVPLPPEGVVLTTKLAEILGIKPGEWLTVEVLQGERPIRKVPVVGLVDELVDLSAYMDIRALHRLIREGETISGAYLAVDSSKIDALYTLLKRTPAVAGVSAHHFLIDQFKKTIGETMGITTLVLIVFACVITFGVVYNTTRIALSERSHELATLRIMGFTQAEVAVILLGEQAILTLAAIPVGFMIGYGWVAWLVAAHDREIFRFPLVISNGSYAFAFIVVAIAAIFSGLIVGRQLAQLDLIAVLKARE
jgi:putative ABC transport system permease protein